MIPRPSQGLADLAAKLASAIAPETASRFAMANCGLMAMLLGALAREMEHGVASRMADIDDMRALFAACGTAADPPRKADRDAFSSRQPRSLQLSDVAALHAEGMRLLIDLHHWAEGHSADLDGQIWDFLQRHTERHRLD